MQVSDPMPGLSADVQRATAAWALFMRALHFRAQTSMAPWSDLPLTVPQMRVLGYLVTRPEGVSGRELAASLGVGPSAVTALMDRLVEQGFAWREEDRNDRRITRLKPTERGIALLERMLAGQRERMAELLARLDADQLQLVTDALETLRAVAEQDATRDVSPATTPA